MPTTDPVIGFLDELQRLAETIEPGEQYTAYRYEGEHAPIGWAIHRPDPDHGHDIVADELRGKHATYFAALDRDVVLALLDVVEAGERQHDTYATLTGLTTVDTIHDVTNYDQRWAARQAYYDAVADWHVKRAALRALAADRVAS